MKAQLKQRPQSKRIRIQSASTTKRSNPKTAEEYFQKAKQYQLNQNYDRAIELYMIATKYKSNYYQAYCNMGFCYRIQGKFVQAKKCYLNSILSNPQDAISHYNLANIYRINGENQLAIDEYSCVISLRQQKNLDVGNLYINSLINIGICYKNKGYIQDAINVNRKVLDINPEEQSGIFNLAICLLNSIETKNSRMFNKFYHQRALEAEQLFNKVKEKSTKNYMVELSLLKISVILNALSENVEKVIVDLKKLQENSDCNIQDEINQQIAVCLNLLKKYDQSARYYQNSIDKKTRRASANSQKNQRKKSDNLIVNIFSQFQEDAINEIDILNMVFITESEVLNLIESGNIKFVKEKISELNEGTALKHILQIILYLHLYEEDENYLYLAAKIYQKHFNNPQEPISFDSISLQGHKAIGKLLNLQGKYEESIAHYQYISESLKDNRTCASAKLHNDLGQRYEQAGNRKKALQQYKTGIEIEPDNYTLTYNLGYCLYDGGNYKEAAKTFQRIIERVKNDDNFKVQTKNLYITDCMIILALCSSDQQKVNDIFEQAFTRFDTLRKTQAQLVEMDEQTLLLFFVNVSQIYEQKLEKTAIESKEWTQLSKKLIVIYQYLLQLKNCPDRDQINFNSGNLNYQLQNYVSANYFYTQISKQSSPPLINIALSYAHILEPVLALKYITEACIQDPNDLVNNVCREMMEWMFMNRRNGDWNKYMPTFKEDLFYQRQQYGLIIIDKISQFINEEQDQKVHKDTLAALIKRHVEIKSKRNLTNIKFTKLSELSEKYNFTSTSLKENNILSEQILKLCFIKSSNIQTDLRALIRHLSKLLPCGRQSQFCQASLYLFIYTNQIQSQQVQAALKKIDSKIVQKQQVSTPGFIKENQDLFSILPDFQNIKEMVAVLKEWEAMLEEKISQTLRTVEKTYYKGRNGTPLQFQYNFPRHSNLNETDETFQKIVRVAIRSLGYDKGLTCRGNNLTQMKDDLIKQFQIHFNRYLKGSKLKPLTISQKFRPISLYASHNSKQQAQQFLNDLSKKLQIPKITIAQESRQLQLTINKLIWIQCHWQSPYSNTFILKEVIQHIVQSPLYIVNQAVLYLQTTITNIKKDSQSAKKYISKDATLNF